MNKETDEATLEIETAIIAVLSKLVATQVAIGDFCHDLAHLAAGTMDKMGELIPPEIADLLTAEPDENPDKISDETDDNSDFGNVIAITPNWHPSLETDPAGDGA